MTQLASILIVEDDPVTQEIVAAALGRAGFGVTVAGTGEDALEVLRSGPSVDWLPTDINLPGNVNGWAVGSEFSLRHPQRPVVYASAAGMPALGSRAVCLAKPYAPQAVVATLQGLIGGEAAGVGHARRPETPQERRTERRVRSMLQGKIIFNNRFSTMDCAVRDLTSLGARLEVACDSVLPQFVEFTLPLRNRKHQAQIIWRRGGECGIRFTS